MCLAYSQAWWWECHGLGLYECCRHWGATFHFFFSVLALLARDVYTYEEFVIVTEAQQCNRMTATEQNTDNKITIYKFTNRQYTKWQKYNIQYRQLCVRSDMCKLEMKNKYVWWINNCIIVLCVPCLTSSVHDMNCLGKETVSVSGCSGAQSSVALTRR